MFAAAMPEPEEMATTEIGVVEPAAPTTTIDAEDGPGASTSAGFSLLARGASIGRYVVLDKIGIGGMGVVYSAYDPELDRKLAIKLLAADHASSRRRSRLLREAQAMAKLKHPNVITVHDVGTVDEKVFVAMEFIDGLTLRQWKTPEHGWRDLVEVFVQAGRGLVAAHAVGLVHRDFKPDNVMVEKGGRVVVMDFGLARADGSEGTLDPADSAIGQGRAFAASALEPTVTAAGTVMGTPAFMAPEQHEGKLADARSDQFSFCVALYRKLYGQAPFKGDELTALAINVSCGNLVPPPADSDVPTWLRDAVLKGLATDPADRHPDMETLLAILEQDRDIPSRRVGPLFAAIGVAVIMIGVNLYLGREDRPCIDADEKLDSMWNDRKAEQLAATFAASGLSFAEEQWPAVHEGLDEYAEAWTTAYTDACRATHVKREESEATFAKRAACLSRGEHELAALLELLSGGDPIALEHALAAVQDLPAVDRCNNIRSGETEGVPRDIAEEVAERQVELATVAALARAGMHREGLQRVDELVEDVRRLGYDPLSASVLAHRAQLQRAVGRSRQAEESYREALSTALLGGADEVAAEAAVGLVELLSTQRERAAEAEGWVELAEALTHRLGEDPAAEARLLTLRASVLQQDQRLRPAAEALRQALEQAERAHGESDPRVAAIAKQLGDVQLLLGDAKQAKALYERALAIVESNLGGEHPQSAAILHALGDIALAAGQGAKAIALHERGLSIREAAGVEHRLELIDSYWVLGLAQYALGDAAQANAQLDRAQALAEEQLGAHHPLVIAMLVHRATKTTDDGNPAEAVRLLEIATRRKKAGKTVDPVFARKGDELRAFMGNRAATLDDARDPEPLLLTLRTLVPG